MKQKSFHTDKGDIVYWISESSSEPQPSLVFLPGLTADHRLFDKQVEYFAGELGWRCLVWDAPSHGKSRPFPLTWSLDDMARWLNEILEQEGIEHPVLVGQSLGGYISQVYMTIFPGKTVGFISIDSAPLGREYYMGWELLFLRHTHAMYSSIPWTLLLKWGSLVATSSYGRALMRTMMEDYEKSEYVDLTAHGYLALGVAAEQKHEHAITCPALLICGDKDIAGSSKRYSREWAKRTGLPLRWIEGAGHNANTDAPDEVNSLIEGFLDEAVITPSA